MNSLDYTLIIIIGISMLHGLSYGILRMMTSILPLALGIYGASIWHDRASALAQSRLGTSPVASDIIGYVAIFLLIFVAVEVVGQRIIALAQLVHLSLLDRLAGAVFGVVLGIIFAGLTIVLLTTILPPNYPLLQNSELAPEILSYDQRLLEYVPPQVKQVYQTQRDRLIRYRNAKQNSPVTLSRTTR